MAWMTWTPRSTSPSDPTRPTTTNSSATKASFEAYINVRDEAESTKLAAFASHLQQLEDNLPLDPKYPQPPNSAPPPDSRCRRDPCRRRWRPRRHHPRAYNLPNDDRVVQQKGSKRVMLKNVQEAKFQQVLLPIAHPRPRQVSPERCEIRTVLHPHPYARTDARPRAASNSSGRAHPQPPAKK